jgi:sugar/nucleoside kinase (ribokinase family)
VVKLSDADAEWLYPGSSPEDAATRILQLGARLAVVTRGSAGALLLTLATQLHIPAIRSVVADTIGAGDSYMAALILGRSVTEPMGSLPLYWSNWHIPRQWPPPSQSSARGQILRPWKSSTTACSTTSGPDPQAPKGMGK